MILFLYEAISYYYIKSVNSVRRIIMAEVNQSVKANAEKAKGLPASVQFAIVTVLPNIVNGAFWGFTDTDDVLEYADALKADKNIQARRIGAGKDCLIEVNPDYLTKAVALVDASLMTANDVNNMCKGRAEAQASFEKMLYVKGEKGGYEGYVGCYCINDTNAINYKGVMYPSFRLTAQEVLILCQKWGYMIEIGGSFVTPNEAIKSPKFFSSLIMSPTKTGVFVKIKSTFTVEQIKALKEKYGIKPSRAKK